MRGNRLKIVAWAWAVALVVAGLPSAAQTTQQPAPPSNVPLIGKTAPPELILLYTGNVVGYIEPCG